MKIKYLLLSASLLWTGLAHATTPSDSGTGDFTASQICKAAISTIMGRSPSIIKATVDSKGISLSYVRPDDGSTWKFRCKLQGTNVLWASDPGRWRNDPADEKISFSVSGSGTAAVLTIVEKFGDITASKDTYKKKDLQ